MEVDFICIIYNKSNKSDIKIFLKKITEKEFKINKNIKDAPWKYLNNKKFKFFFVYYHNIILGVMVVINFRFTRHLSFIYLLKEFLITFSFVL